MKKVILAAVLVGCGLFARAQGDKNFIDQPYIEVTGKAEREIIPDKIYLKITINEKDNKGRVSLEQQENQMKAELKKIGVEVAKDLTVKDLNSDFMSYWYKGNEIFTSKEYQLLVRNAATAGRAIQTLKKINVSNVALEKVDHSEMEKFRREVKIEAIKAAKGKASDLLEAIGHKAGRALWVMEYEQPAFRPHAANVMVKSKMSADVAEPQPELEFQSIKLVSSVSAKFAIE
ncbi:MAG: SIMPL domain-containing protein [Prevotellaceae bacterium]|jgi:uncharacterized protein YggE|nr:SIMPL domain-containing protein [Prevotellaceae bacterium]